MGTKFTINDILGMGSNKGTIEKLIDTIKTDKRHTNVKVVPFIGAGLSVDYGYPLWGKTIELIASSFSAKSKDVEACLNEGNCIEAAEILYKENPKTFREKLIELLSEKGKDFSSTDTASYYVSLLFHDSLLITSNYDTVFENIYQLNKYKTSKVTPMASGELSNMLKSGNNNKSIIFKFHGDAVTSNDKDIIIAREDYDRLYGSDLLDSLKKLAGEYSFLFVGSKLDFEAKEPDRFLKLIDDVSAKDSFNRHYAILPFDITAFSSEDEWNKAMREKSNKMVSEHNIDVIFFPDGEYHCIKEILKHICGKTGCVEDKIKDSEKEEKQPIGILLEYGMNSCTIYEIDYSREESVKQHDTWKKVKRIHYLLDFPDDLDYDKIAEYKENLVTITNEEILPYVRMNYPISFIKVVADASFRDEGMPFAVDKDRNEFVERFYTSTNLFFNVLEREQIKYNLQQLFSDNFTEKTVIVDIGSTSVELYFTNGKKLGFESLVLNISANTVKDYLTSHNIEDKNLLRSVKDLKTYIQDIIKKDLGSATAEEAIIIKNEATYMKRMGYYEGKLPKKGISWADYSKKNRDVLYGKAYEEKFNSAFGKPRFKDDRKAYNGYRYGHLILEAIFELLGVHSIIPSDLHSIHGSSLAYVSNVVLSGSTKAERREYMEKAYKFFADVLSINVSPEIDDIDFKDLNSYKEHAKKIRSCDLLFVCNGDGYLGSQTKCDIYGAYLLSIPIAYWRDPIGETEEGELDYSKVIPHEVLGQLIEST